MDFTLGDCLFGAVKVTNNADPGKNGYSSHGIGFDAHSKHSLSNSEEQKIFFGVHHSPSMHADNRKNDMKVQLID